MKNFILAIMVFAAIGAFAAPTINTASGSLHTVSALIDEQRLTFNLHLNGAYDYFDTSYVSVYSDHGTYTCEDVYGIGAIKFGLGYAVTNWLEAGFVIDALVDGIDTPEADGRPNENANYGSYGLGNAEINLKLTTGRLFGSVKNMDLGVMGFYRATLAGTFEALMDSASFVSRRYLQSTGGLIRYFESGSGDWGGKFLASYMVEGDVPVMIDVNGGYTQLTGMPASIDPMMIDYSASIAAKFNSFVPFLEVFGFKYSATEVFGGNLINYISGGVRFDTPSGFVLDLGADFRMTKFATELTPSFNNSTDTVLYTTAWEGAPSWVGHVGFSYYYDFKKDAPKVKEIKKTLITGKVIDSETGKPVVAMVSLPGYSEEVSILTDTLGLYTVEVKPGTIRVKVDKQGYISDEKGVVIEAEQTQILDFAMKVKKIAKGTITGKVIDKSTNELVNAKLSIPDAQTGEFYPDAATGIYKVTLDPGTYTITAKAEGYLDYAVPVVIEEDKTLVMNVELLKKGGKINLKGINFESGKANILPESYVILNDAVKLLKDNPKVKIEVQGHTDSVGAAASNETLSQARADAVRKYLVDNGIDAARIQTKGYGELMPIASNDTKEGRAQNRRIEFLILGE
ncbi:MAG: OmpA family protein [bacterium]|nr:OmpA family protein [bacterium]